MPPTMGTTDNTNQTKNHNRPSSGVIATLAALVLVSLATLGVLFSTCLCAQKLPEEARVRQILNPRTAEAEAEVAKPVSVLFVGDMMLGRDVESTSKRRSGYDYPFSETVDLLQSADITVGNLETPLTPGEPVATESMTFRADTEWARALATAGFDVVGLANNHIPNQGTEGIQDTLESLDAANVLHTGAGMDIDEALTPAVVTVRGLRIAFLAFNDTDVVPDGYFATDGRAGTALMEIGTLPRALATAREVADFVVVMMHSGTEYSTSPNQRQIDFAHAAVDNGADLVIGHHPHVVESVEVYNGKYIFYSLGNFIFDQMWSLPTREGMVMRVTINEAGVSAVQLQPIEIFDYAQPRLVTDEALARSILDVLDLGYGSIDGPAFHWQVIE